MDNADFLQMCRYAVSDDKDERRPGRKGVCQSELAKNSIQVVSTLLAMIDIGNARAEAAEAKLLLVDEYAKYCISCVEVSEFYAPFDEWLDKQGEVEP